MSQRDDVFIKTFSVVVGGLALFTVVLLVFANLFQGVLTTEVSEARLEARDERVAPVGAVYAGEAGQQALAQADEDSGAGEEAASEPMSGEAVYQNVCAACHDTGAGGSPTLTPDAWESRLAKGRETLVNHAINGFQGDSGMMPAKGGRADLSDDEVAAAVDYMIGQVQP